MANDLSTGSFISLVLLGGGGGRGGFNSSTGVDRMKGGWDRPHPQQAGPKIPSSVNVRVEGKWQSPVYVLSRSVACPSKFVHTVTHCPKTKL
jgi:hypothetical protein